MKIRFLNPLNAAVWQTLGTPSHSCNGDDNSNAPRECCLLSLVLNDWSELVTRVCRCQCVKITSFSSVINVYAIDPIVYPEVNELPKYSKVCAWGLPLTKSHKYNREKDTYLH